MHAYLITKVSRRFFSDLFCSNSREGKDKKKKLEVCKAKRRKMNAIKDVGALDMSVNRPDEME